MKLLIIALALTSSACSFAADIPTQPTYTPPPPDVSAFSIRLTGSSQPDRTIQVAATVLTKDGNFVPGATVTFDSSSGTMSPAYGITDQVGMVKVSLISLGVPTQVTAKSGSLVTMLQVIGPATNP